MTPAPDFDKRGGLVATVVQHFVTREVLMVGSQNREAWEETLASGRATFWSTSRSELWLKGQTSGDYLNVREVRLDCDRDAVLLLVIPAGEGACHTQNLAGKARTSCFFYRGLAGSDTGWSWTNLDP